jgi:hypothetical protein
MLHFPSLIDMNIEDAAFEDVAELDAVVEPELELEPELEPEPKPGLDNVV